MKRTKLGVLIGALALAALAAGCEAFYWITGAPCEVPADTIRVDADTSAAIKPGRCLEKGDDR